MVDRPELVDGDALLAMMSALTSISNWVWLAAGDLVNVVLMNRAVRSEKSFEKSLSGFGMAAVLLVSPWNLAGVVSQP